MRNVNAIWEGLVRRYNKRTAPIPFDFKHVVLETLGEKRSNNYPHYIHYYPGKIFPYIPLFLLSLDRLCSPEGVVLDPFSGSGSVLLESIINPVHKRDAWGVEINPLGRLISKVKTTPISTAKARHLLEHIIRYNRNPSHKKDLPIPEFKNIDLWFSKKAIRQLAQLRHSIENLEAERDYKDFFWLCFSVVIRKVAKADPFIPPPVILKPYKYKNSGKKYEHMQNFLKNAEKPNVISIYRDTVESNLTSIDALNHIREVKTKRIRVGIIWDDAKDIRLSRMAKRAKIIKSNNPQPFPSNSVDLIITSPPYITAQKYIRTHRLELLWLGLLNEEQLQQLDRKLIGTERVSPKEVDFDAELGVERIDRLIKRCVAVSPERAAAVYRYFHDMRGPISEMYRVLKNDAYAVLVVGNNTVLKKKVNTYRLLADIAISLGFKEVLILKDDIRGRGMITKRHNTGGLIKEEYIIVLKKEKSGCFKS